MGCLRNARKLKWTINRSGWYCYIEHYNKNYSCWVSQKITLIWHWYHVNIQSSDIHPWPCHPSTLSWRQLLRLKMKATLVRPNNLQLLKHCQSDEDYSDALIQGMAALIEAHLLHYSSSQKPALLFFNQKQWQVVSTYN